MGGKKRRAIAKEAKDAADQSMLDAEGRREVAQAGVDKQRAAYESFEFTNPFAGMENPYAENVYEDLTVNQQQAQFQAQQGQQQRANIMQQMQGAAGGSGIAALAQTLANQGQLQTQQISASIGQQEAMNQRLAAQGAKQVQAGAAAVDLQQRQGEAMVQQAESGRISTLLGMEYGALTGAEAAVQQGFANQQSAIALDAQMFAANQQMIGSIVGGALGAAGSVAGAVIKESDRRLKKNINKIDESPSGLNIYSFEYKNPIYGEGLFQGVMSDEIPQEAVGKRNGYDTVDYSMLDVEFKKI